MKIELSIDLIDKEETLARLDELQQVVAAYYARKTSSEPSPAVRPDPEVLADLGAGASTVYASLLSTIAQKGEATLEDVAAETGWSLGTIRAHLMNAGRTLKARGAKEPVTPTWSPSRNCVVYTAGG